MFLMMTVVMWWLQWPAASGNRRSCVAIDSNYGELERVKEIERGGRQFGGSNCSQICIFLFISFLF